MVGALPVVVSVMPGRIAPMPVVTRLTAKRWPRLLQEKETPLQSRDLSSEPSASSPGMYAAEPPVAATPAAPQSGSIL